MVKAVIFDMYETLITLFESPVYFGEQIAEDLGIEKNAFVQAWKQTIEEQTTGKTSLEEALERIMHSNRCYDATLLNKVAAKRMAAKRETFNHLHPGIMPMLMELKNRQLKIGLISNCFSEEALVIRESILFPFFDAVYLSYEQGVQKPDHEIFRRCLMDLDVEAHECLYVGDGGSNELEASEELGMKALQATWYLKEGTTQPAIRKAHVLHLEAPTDVLGFIQSSTGIKK